MTRRYGIILQRKLELVSLPGHSAVSFETGVRHACVVGSLAVSQLNLTVILRSRCYYHSYLTDEETEAIAYVTCPLVNG